MRVFAAQIGAAGASIGVVAENFQRLVTTIEEYLQGFSKMVDKLCEDMQKVTLEVGALKVQIDMVDFFVRASLHRILSKECDAAQAFLELEDHSQMFTNLSQEFSRISLQGVHELRTSIHQFLATGKDIKKFVNGIELISQIGAVEAARLSSTEKDFSHYIETMHEFSNVLRNSTQKMIRSTRTLVDSIHFIDDSLNQVSGSMDEIFALAFSLHKLVKKDDHAA
jgi:aerotaxis receptor